MAENESKYVPAGGKGSSTLFVVDEAQGTLRLLARTLPGQFARSLGKLGSLLRKDIRAAMESGGPQGGRWSPVVDWGPNGPQRSGRRKRKSKRKNASRYSATAGNWLRDHFFRQDGTGRPYGRLYSAGRYLLDKERLMVQVGWVTPTAASSGKAVQASLRGPKNSWKFDGDQPVTRSMRRALAAAGLVLSKSKRSMRQAQRPLMRRIFQNFEPQIPGIIEKSVARYLAEGKSS